MLKNLRAEMARYGVSIGELSQSIGVTERCVRNKISGRQVFSFPEARTIRDVFFTGMTLEYLFDETGAVE